MATPILGIDWLAVIGYVIVALAALTIAIALVVGYFQVISGKAL
jgi:hypothetical protein